MKNDRNIYLNKIKRDKILVLTVQILVLFIFLLLWEVAANKGVIDSFITSSPSRILKSFLSFYNAGNLFNNIWVTCYETILGFTLGTILGAVIAILLWIFPFVSKVLDPYLVVLNALPKVALAPIIILSIFNLSHLLPQLPILYIIFLYFQSITSNYI